METSTKGVKPRSLQQILGPLPEMQWVSVDSLPQARQKQANHINTNVIVCRIMKRTGALRPPDAISQHGLHCSARRRRA